MCECVGVVVRTCETCMGITTIPPPHLDCLKRRSWRWKIPRHRPWWLQLVDLYRGSYRPTRRPTTWQKYNRRQKHRWFRSGVLPMVPRLKKPTVSQLRIAKNYLLTNAINGAPIGKSSCIFYQKILPCTLRSRSVRIGVVRFEKMFSRQPVR